MVGQLNWLKICFWQFNFTKQINFEMSCNTICIDQWISARKLANITQLALPSCPPSLPHLILSLKNKSVSGRRPLKQQFQRQQNCNSFCMCEYVNLRMYLPYYYRLHVIFNLTPFSCNMITAWLRLFAVLSLSWPTKIAMKTATHREWSQTWSPSLKQPCQRRQHRKFISHSCNNMGHVAVSNHPWLCHNMF